MTIFRIIHIGALLACVALGLIVFFQHYRRPANQFFALLTATLCGWLSFMMLAFQSLSPESAAFYIRKTNSVAALVPYLFDCLRLAVLQPERKFRSILFHSPFWLTTSLLMSAMCQTSFFLRSAELPDSGAWGVPVPVYGPGILIFGLYFAGTMIALISRYVSGIRTADGIRKTEIQFIILSWAVGTIVGTAFSFLIPVLTGFPQSVQLLPLAAVFILAVIAYGIATRRIMAVADVLRRATAYGLLLAYLVLLYIGVWWIARHLLKPVEWSDFAAHLLAGLAAAFSLAPAHGRMQRVANRLFISVELLDVADIFEKTNRIISSITTRDELLTHFANLLTTAVGADKIFILTKDNHDYRQAYPLESQDKRREVSSTGALAKILLETNEPMSLDMLRRFRATPDETAAGQELHTLGTSIAIGIHGKREMKGILLLGPRLSGRIYGRTEQRTLQALCNQLAVGLENADLYTQVKDSAIYNDILLDSVVTGIIAVNRDGLITICNREAHRLLDAPPGSLTKNSIDKLPRALAAALRATIDHDSGSRNVETTIKTADADARPIRFSTAPFSSHTGKQLGALLVMEDLTALKKLENQIRRTDRLASIGTLSAGMAHEIKNPLVTLKTFTDLLPERYQDADFRDTFSSLVGQEVKRIDSIVNQLLRFARPAKPSLHPTRIHDVLDNTLRLVHQQLKQKQIQLVREYEAPNDLIQGDNDLLVQAFLNFFLNAIDAMEREGVLTIRTDFAEIETNQLTLGGGIATETRLRVAIRDNGVGIKPEDLPHVFDPFFTTKSTGTGLGLSVSHGIISEHRGIMDVESVLGAGSTFYILFPVATVEVPA